ncbi:MAG TPA: hypothetical protein VG370_12750 [Chloroflexota bacterium]|nr:hypothetical protein [Chloroflexota bacterium]
MGPLGGGRARAIPLEAPPACHGSGDPVQKSGGSLLFYVRARGAFLAGTSTRSVLPAGLLIAARVLAFAPVRVELGPVPNPRLGRP